jgi:hypothetical protein
MVIRGEKLLPNQVFNEFTVIEKSYSGKHRESYYLCKCSCGELRRIRKNDLISGEIKSCGCNGALRKDKIRLKNIRNGIIQRCNNSKCPNYRIYGARGIKVCDEWLNPISGLSLFIEWALSNNYGNKLQLDRINNDGNYEPSNCRWATRKEQLRNTSRNINIVYKDKEMCMEDFIKKYVKNVSRRTVYRRYNKGWTLDQILSTKPFCVKRERQV